MRNIDMLKDMRKIQKLLAWLYSDEKNTITVVNGMGTPITLSMDQDGEMKALYESTTVPQPYDHMLSIPIWLGIVEQMEQQPPIRKNTELKSRWDEIMFEYSTLAALNDF